MPRVQFNTPMPRVSKQPSPSLAASPGHVTGPSSSASGSGTHSHLPLLLSSPPHSLHSSDCSQLEKDKRRRSALPVFAIAAAVAAILLLLLVAGTFLPPGAPLIVMPHPPTLALLRDAGTLPATKPPQPLPAQQPLPQHSASAALARAEATDASTVDKASTVHRLKQRLSEQQPDSVHSEPRETQQPIANAGERPQPLATAAQSTPDHHQQPQQQQPALASSLLSAPPLLLSPYYARNLSGIARFHNTFFDEPYMRDRNIPLSDRSLLASNRALPHTFPAPLAAVPALLSSSVVIGVFCYNVARIEAILDTWATFLEPAHLLIFSEPSSDPAAQRKQESMASVIIMDNDANKHRNVTDRRASAWKILPAVRLMFQRHPASPWYYLCDDDSFPLVPNLAHFTANFYSSANGAYTPQHAMYVGESVLQQTFYKGYYADEKVRRASNQPLSHSLTHSTPMTGSALVGRASASTSNSCPRRSPHLSSLLVFPFVLCCVVLSGVSIGSSGRSSLPLHRWRRVAEPRHNVSVDASRGPLLHVLRL